MKEINSVLIVGATGSIGRLVAEEALEQKYDVCVLVRDAQRANFDDQVRVIQGDLTQPIILDYVDAVIFTQGSYDSHMAEFVDYNGVRNVLNALKGKLKRIGLMTSIYATSDRENSYWKRRAERLVRASGIPYTIIRPSWFDHNQADELALILTQNNDKHIYTFTSQDGGVSRQQIAKTLVNSLQNVNATNRTVALFSYKGQPTCDFAALFSNTLPDVKEDSFDGIHDPKNLPLEQEPERVLLDLRTVHQ